MYRSRGRITLTVRPTHRLLVGSHLLKLQQHTLHQAKKRNLSNSIIQYDTQYSVKTKENLPTTPRRESRQWLTGFFATLSLSDFPGTLKAAPDATGCHGGIVTNMLSVGSHSFCGVSGETCDGLLVASTELPVVGSWGIKVPSSRSLSYTMIVPSACDTKKSVDERGTHRTAVHGDPEIEPLLMISLEGDSANTDISLVC